VLPVGSLTITADYSGDNNFNPSSTSEPFSVAKANEITAITTTTASITFGQPVTFVITVSPIPPNSGTPTGNVTVTAAGTPLVLTLSGGQASFTTSTLPVGQDAILASYNGDNNFNAASGASFTESVSAPGTTITLTSSANPSVFGQLVTFTAVVSASSGTPTGTVNFAVDGGSAIPASLNSGQATFSTAALGIGGHSITATYIPDNNNFTGSGPVSLTQNVSQGTTTTTLTSSPNPSTPGQPVTFTATVKVATGTGTPTGTVTFKDNGTPIGTGNLIPGGTATFTTSTLTTGSHNITAVYGGDTNFAGSTSAVLIQNVNNNSDSIKLRELQISATPIIAQGWGQAVSAAMDDAVSAGFGGNPQSLSPAGTGFTYYFNDDPPARPQAASDQDPLRRYLAAPDGSVSSPNGNAKRFDDDFRALGYAGGMPTKAPPPAATGGAPRDWLAWINVRGTDYFCGTFGNDLKGDQVDAFVGLTRRISPNFVVGAFGGYEHFRLLLASVQRRAQRRWLDRRRAFGARLRAVGT
jgi:hypothetical protein